MHSEDFSAPKWKVPINLVNGRSIENAVAHVPEVQVLKYGPPAEWGWGPRLRQRFGYVAPDDWYEATVWDFVAPGTAWLDVGCGRNVFPFNRPTAKLLADRCSLLVGIDPSNNIDENTIVHQREKCVLEDYRSDREFDIVTMRMVAEHISDPGRAVAALGRLTRPDGVVIIYTVDKWSPASLLASATPLSVHVFAKRLLWGSAERDAFPTVYALNTRADLHRHFGDAGFSEVSFVYVDDCRSLSQRRTTAQCELVAWRTLKALRLPYPDRCILAIYRKAAARQETDNATP